MFLSTIILFEQRITRITMNIFYVISKDKLQVFQA